MVVTTSLHHQLLASELAIDSEDIGRLDDNGLALRGLGYGGGADAALDLVHIIHRKRTYLGVLLYGRPIRGAEREGRNAD